MSKANQHLNIKLAIKEISHKQNSFNNKKNESKSIK